MATENNPVSFETLWEQTEEVAAKKYKDSSTEQVLKELGDLLINYNKLATIEQEEIKVSLKKRYLGEMLFMITLISGRDNINIYAALQECKTIMDL